MRPFSMRLLTVVISTVILIVGAVSMSQSEGAIRPLSQGDRGEPVIALQRLLQQHGFDPGPFDGVFGPLTDAAVRRYQESEGLAVDGVAGAQTLTGLRGGEGSVDASPQLEIHQASAVSGSAAVMAPAPSGGRFALTFNGNPDPVLLPELLATLQRHEMKATFFVTGEMAAERPELLVRIAEAGHEIGSSGQVAIDMTHLTEPMMSAQILQSARQIEAVIGKAPTLFRPPLGRFDERLAKAAEGAGMGLQLWSNVAVKDPLDADPLELTERIKEAVFAGAVIMVHQDRQSSVEAMDPLLAILQAGGYQSVRLSDLR